jgi:hypothetical protein
MSSHVCGHKTKEGGRCERRTSGGKCFQHKSPKRVVLSERRKPDWLDMQTFDDDKNDCWQLAKITRETFMKCLDRKGWMYTMKNELFTSVESKLWRANLPYMTEANLRALINAFGLTVRYHKSTTRRDAEYIVRELQHLNTLDGYDLITQTLEFVERDTSVLQVQRIFNQLA